MLLTLECVEIFKTQLSLTSFLFNSPFKWVLVKRPDAKGGSIGRLIYSTKSSKSLALWYARHVISWVHWLFLIWRFIGITLIDSKKEGHIHLITLLSFGIWFFTNISGWMLGATLLFRRDQICLLFNYCMTFWRKHFNFRAQEGYLHYILLLFLITIPNISIILPVLFWITPCAPQFIYSVVSSSCTPTGNELWDSSQLTLTRKLLKVGFYFIEIFGTLPVSACGGFLVIIIIIKLTFLNDFLKHIRDLGSINLAFQDRPALYRSGIKRQAFLYRQLQLLVSLFNECYQDYCYPTVFICHAGYNVLGLFAVIEIRNSVPLIQFVMYPFMVCLCVAAAIFMLEYANLPLTLSKSIKNNWRKGQFARADSWLSKFSRSCPTLQIYTVPRLTVGRERLAIFFRFCLQRTVFLVVYNERINGTL